MYRRPKFLEKLIEIRLEMAAEADYDVDLFAEITRSGRRPPDQRGSLARGRGEKKGIAEPDKKALVETGDQ